jgi:hypothetical protein
MVRHTSFALTRRGLSFHEEFYRRISLFILKRIWPAESTPVYRFMRSVVIPSNASCNRTLKKNLVTNNSVIIDAALESQKRRD